MDYKRRKDPVDRIPQCHQIIAGSFTCMVCWSWQSKGAPPAEDQSAPLNWEKKPLQKNLDAELGDKARVQALVLPLSLGTCGRQKKRGLVRLSLLCCLAHTCLECKLECWRTNVVMRLRPRKGPTLQKLWNLLLCSKVTWGESLGLRMVHQEPTPGFGHFRRDLCGFRVCHGCLDVQLRSKAYHVASHVEECKKESKFKMRHVNNALEESYAALLRFGLTRRRLACVRSSSWTTPGQKRHFQAQHGTYRHVANVHVHASKRCCSRLGKS